MSSEFLNQDEVYISFVCRFSTWRSAAIHSVFIVFIVMSLFSCGMFFFLYFRQCFELNNTKLGGSRKTKVDGPVTFRPSWEGGSVVRQLTSFSPATGPGSMGTAMIPWRKFIFVHFLACRWPLAATVFTLFQLSLLLHCVMMSYDVSIGAAAVCWNIGNQICRLKCTQFASVYELFLFCFFKQGLVS